MDVAPKIELAPEHWTIVEKILKHHLPHTTVWAFGSRATFSAKPFSDLDLAVIADKPLPLSTHAAIEHDFTESDLPIKVDVVDWASLDMQFQEIIRATKVVVWPFLNN